MPAYLIAMLDVTDAESYEKYKAKAPAAIAKAGGKYLVRGGEVTALEGTHDGRRVVVLEFPSLEGAKAFYHGDLYQQAKALRKDSARNVTFLLVPGVP